jgi:hypothetical protein
MIKGRGGKGGEGREGREGKGGMGWGETPRKQILATALINVDTIKNNFVIEY